MPKSVENATDGAAYSKVINYVISAISEKELNPGDKLEPERNLSAILGVSRGTVREAIRVLNYLGFVDCVQGSGNFISDNYGDTVTKIISVMYSRGDLTKTSFNDFRQMLDICAFDLALVKSTDEQRAEMKQIATLMDVCSSPNLIFALDKQFHSLMVVAADNPLISINYTALSTITEKFMSDVFYNTVTRKPDGFKTLQRYHHAIIDSLIARDREGGHKAIHGHYDWVL